MYIILKNIVLSLSCILIKFRFKLHKIINCDNPAHILNFQICACFATYTNTGTAQGYVDTERRKSKKCKQHGADQLIVL